MKKHVECENEAESERVEKTSLVLLSFQSCARTRRFHSEVLDRR